MDCDGPSSMRGGGDDAKEVGVNGGGGAGRAKLVSEASASVLGQVVPQQRAMQYSRNVEYVLEAIPCQIFTHPCFAPSAYVDTWGGWRPCIQPVCAFRRECVNLFAVSEDRAEPPANSYAERFWCASMRKMNRAPLLPLLHLLSRPPTRRTAHVMSAACVHAVPYESTVWLPLHAMTAMTSSAACSLMTLRTSDCLSLNGSNVVVSKLGP